MERTITSEEAKRWLGTAEKLLAARDLLGAKSFAIRVREAYPGLDAADDIIAVADTIIAGEHRINGQRDWYAVLQLPRFTQGLELVATQYRRLALLLNPHRNRLPYADEAFRLVCEAWSVVSNPSKKLFYDNELNVFPRFDFGAGSGSGSGQLHERQFLQRHQHYQQQQQAQPPPPQPLFQARPQPQPHQQPQPQQQSQPQPQPQPQSQPQLQAQPQQQQRPVRKSPRNKEGKAAEEEERPNLNNVAESTRSAEPARATRQAQSTREAGAEGDKSFWTACPYCYILYEYPKVYEECVLRCQNCKRAFHAAVIPSPPVRGKDDTYFCCWGFFPLGFSGKVKEAGASSGWMPFSPMFACPIQAEGKKNEGKGKRPNGGSPRFIYKDDDIFVELSDESEESDVDWQTSTSKRNKKAKPSKGKAPAAKNVKTTPTDRVTRGSQSGGGQVNGGGGDENLDGGAGPSKTEANRKAKAGASGGKKKGAVEWGRLDLNVEFSNDVEEPATGVNKGNGAGHGEEDNIEGIGFFEGLDEFLSSLPILNVVGDDKVKAT